MSQFIVFLIGLLIACNICELAYIYLLTKEANEYKDALSEELQTTLREVQESHNQTNLTLAAADQRWQEMRQTIVGLEQRLNTTRGTTIRGKLV